MYPTLTEMGVTSTRQIVAYDYYQSRENEDTLRIKYRRQTGSFLPETRVYRFRRPDVPTEAGATKIASEVSPILNKALAELETLLQDKVQAESLATEINEALAAVEAEVARVRHLTKQLKDKSTAATAAS